MKTQKITSFEYDFEHNIAEITLNNRTIKFSIEEIKSIDLKKLINYKSLFLFIGCLGLFNYFIYESEKTQIEFYVQILLNIIFFMAFSEFIYKPIYSLKISKKEKKCFFIIDDYEIFLEFIYFKEYVSQTKII